MSKQCICKGSLLNYKSNCRWKLFLIAFAGKLIEKVCEMPQAATKASRALEMVLLKKILSASLKFTRLIFLTMDTTITNARPSYSVVWLEGIRFYNLYERSLFWKMTKNEQTRGFFCQIRISSVCIYYSVCHFKNKIKRLNFNMCWLTSKDPSSEKQKRQKRLNF